MAQPTRTQVHIDKPLTNFSLAFKQDAKAFIASRVFPEILVEKQSDKYFIFDRTTFMRDDAKIRGVNEESAGSGYGVSNDSYYCDLFALHKDCSVLTGANTDAPLNQDRNAVEFVTQSLLLRRERQWASDAFAVSVWTDTVVGSSTLLWDDYLSCDVIRAVDNAKRAILARTGRMANKLVLGMDVFLALKEHPDVVDRIKYTSRDVTTEQILAGLLSVDEILVPYGLVDSGSEGKTASSIGFVVNAKSALLLHTPAAPAIETPMAGACFMWTGNGDRPGGFAARKFYMEHLQTNRVECEMALDIRVTAPDLGVFWSSIVG